MAMSNFGEQFAAKTLRRVYQMAVFPAITNSNYEGEIKNAGDRVNILSFPGDFQLEDYVAGTDMSTFAIYDMEDQLVVEKRKSHNFAIDRLEELFTYVDDAADNLVENVAKAVERTIDAYVLEQAQFARAGNWVGIDIRIAGSSSDTHASIATSATGGTVVLQFGTAGGDDGATVEHGDGTSDFGGLTAADVGKPIRLTSSTTWATEWYRITAVSDTVTATLENWDGATAAPDIPNGDVLRGLYGAKQFTGGAANGDGKPTSETGWGWELQAARATTIAVGNVYEQIVALGQKLDENEIPDTDRHITGSPEFIGVLKSSSDIATVAVEQAYDGVIINGKVMRVSGFEIHMASGARVSTRIGHASSSGQGADVSVTASTTQGSQILANHISFITFAYKWSESRIVDAESQFAKKYQALHLFGAKVPGIRRRAGAVLYGTI